MKKSVAEVDQQGVETDFISGAGGAGCEGPEDYVAPMH